MARPKVCVRGPGLPTDPSHALRRAEGQQVTATTLRRPSAGSVKENNEQVSVRNSTVCVVEVLISPPRPQLPAVPEVKTEHDFSPTLEEKLLRETPISATISITFPGAKRQQVTAPALRPSTGSVKENDEHVLAGNSTASVVADLIHPPRPQPRVFLEAKTEQDLSPALGEKRPPNTPIAATIASAFPGSKDLQATAPAVWPSTRAPAEGELGHGPGGEFTSLLDVIQLQRAYLDDLKRNLDPASARISTAAVVKVEGSGSMMPSSSDSQGVTAPKKRKPGEIERKASVVGKKAGAVRGFHLSVADLVSDAHLRLTEKAEKLGISTSSLKNRRRSACLKRWPGRQVRAEMKRAQAQARA